MPASMKRLAQAETNMAINATPRLARNVGTTAVDLSELEQRALRKAAWRLIPLLALAYFFNYLDRTSVGFAALTMNKDLGLTATQFGWGAGVMFFGYCLFEVPSNLAMYRFGARRWMARIMITWGIAAAATALAVGPNSFYLIRSILGIAEAGFFPGVIFYLSTWFPPQYRTRVLTWFTLAVPLSSLIGGPVSTALLQVDGWLGLKGWQWMFIIEGLPACLLGFVTLKILADKPADAKWLTKEECMALQKMAAGDNATKQAKNSLGSALKDVRIYILGLITFSFTIGSYGIGIWLPQILKGHGLSTMTTGWISAIPYFFVAIGMLLWARRVDKSGRRILNLAVACILSGLGLIFSIAFDQLVPALAGITLALVGTNAARSIFYTIPSRFLSGQAAAGGIALINTMGAMGGFVGPYLVGYLKDATGSFKAGMIGLAVVLAIATLLTFSLQYFMRDE
jgi:ACS family tartrate transporter-like MFS transporter